MFNDGKKSRSSSWSLYTQNTSDLEAIEPKRVYLTKIYEDTTPTITGDVIVMDVTCQELLGNPASKL